MLEPEDPDEPEELDVTEPEDEEELEALDDGVVGVVLGLVDTVAGGGVPVVPPAGTVRPVGGLVPVPP